MQNSRITQWIVWGAYIALTVLPLALGLGYALGYSLGLTGVLNSGWTTQHWEQVLASKELWQSLGLSLYIAVSSMGIAVGIALWVVSGGQSFRERGPMGALLYLPLTLPAVVVAFFFFQVLTQSGFLSRVFFQLGAIGDLHEFPEWTHDVWGIGIILAHIFMAAPFFILYMGNLYEKAGLEALRKMAFSLGASSRQVRFRVIWPVLLHRARPTIILYGIFVMGSYEIPLLLGSQSPRMITVFALSKLQKFNLMDIPQAYAISIVYAVGILLLTLGSLVESRKN